MDLYDTITDERNTLRTLLQSLLIMIHRDQRVIERRSKAPRNSPIDLDAYRIATEEAVDIVLRERPVETTA